MRKNVSTQPETEPRGDCIGESEAVLIGDNPLRIRGNEQQREVAESWGMMLELEAEAENVSNP